MSTSKDLRACLPRLAATLLVLASVIAPHAAHAQRTAALTGLAVSGTSASATVTWEPVEGAVSYSVKRWKQDDLKCCNNSAAELSRPGWTDTGPSNEGFPQPGVYLFEVTAQLRGTTSAATINWTLAAGAAPSVVLSERTKLRAVPATRLTAVNTLAGPPPQNVRVLPGGPMVHTLVWDPAPGASGYNVLRHNAATGEWLPANGTPLLAPTFVDTNLVQPGAKYRVAALYSDGRQGSTDFLFSNPPPFQVPTGFSAEKLGPGKVRLSWQPVAFATGYRVIGVGQPPDGALVNATELVLSGLADGEHSWKLTADYGGAYQTAGMPTASITLAPAPAPTGLTVTGTPASATLAWQPVVGVVSYVVTRQQANAPATQQTLAPTNTGMHDSGLQPATAYTYTVRAIQSDGREASTEVLFTTPPAVNPSGFTAMQTAEGIVKLTWKSVPNVSFYQLWGPGTPNTGLTVTGTTQTVSGVPSGPQHWKIGSFYAPGPASTAATMFPTISLFVTTASLCAMAQPQVGWGPQAVVVIPGGMRGAALRWPPAYQAVAYTVERALQGSGPHDRPAVEKITAWTVVGSTCSGSALMFKRPTLAADGPVPAGDLGFLDISPGVVPGLEYVYRVKAFDASGKMGWEPRWWWAPNPGGLRFDTVSVNGRTVTLTLATDWATSRPPNEMSITTSYGYSSLPEPIVVTPTYRWTTRLLSVPAGTHTITVTARWTMLWDGTLPRVVDSRTGSREITVNP